jgi:hypothetical protein
VSAAAVGAITYGVSCANDYAMTQVAYTAPTTSVSATPTPAVTLTSNMNSQVVAQNVTLSWSAKNSAGCSATGGRRGRRLVGCPGTLGLNESQRVKCRHSHVWHYVHGCTPGGDRNGHGQLHQQCEFELRLKLQRGRRRFTWIAFADLACDSGGGKDVATPSIGLCIAGLVLGQP